MTGEFLGGAGSVGPELSVVPAVEAVADPVHRIDRGDPSLPDPIAAKVEQIARLLARADAAAARIVPPPTGV